MQNVCLKTYRNNRIRQKVAFFFKEMHTSQENNSRDLRIKNANFSGYYFCTSVNI